MERTELDLDAGLARLAGAAARDARPVDSRAVFQRGRRRRTRATIGLGAVAAVAILTPVVWLSLGQAPQVAGVAAGGGGMARPKTLQQAPARLDFFDGKGTSTTTGWPTDGATLTNPPEAPNEDLKDPADVMVLAQGPSPLGGWRIYTLTARDEGFRERASCLAMWDADGWRGHGCYAALDPGEPSYPALRAERGMGPTAPPAGKEWVFGLASHGSVSVDLEYTRGGNTIVQTERLIGGGPKQPFDYFLATIPADATLVRVTSYTADGRRNQSEGKPTIDSPNGIYGS
jgi:hypothetical protein